MRSTLILLVLLVAALLVYLVFLQRQVKQPEDDTVARAFARAEAYYVNEENRDYRRARLELLPLKDRLGQTMELHVNLALLDLQEINYRVQDERRIFRVNDFHKLARSALEHLQRADEIAPGHPTVEFNLARAYIQLTQSPVSSETLTQLNEAALEILTRLSKVEAPDATVLLLLGERLFHAGDFAGSVEAYRRIREMGEDFVPETIYRIACLREGGSTKMIDRAKGAAMEREVKKRFPDAGKAPRSALERGRYTLLLRLGDVGAPKPAPRTMNWIDLTRRALVPEGITYFIAPDFDGDCARDLVVAKDGKLRILRNSRRASFEDITEHSGLPLDFELSAAAVGDIDGDGSCDLVIGGPSGWRAFLNTTGSDNPTKWQFSEAIEPFDTAAVRCLLLWDLDHDGDMDLFVGGDKNRCYRLALEKPATGGVEIVYTDVTQELGMDAPAADAVLLLDVEQDSDVDLLIQSRAGNVWFANLRQMQFEKRPLPSGGSLAAFDVDHDLTEEIGLDGKVYDWDGSVWVPGATFPMLVDLDGDGMIDDDGAAALGVDGAITRVLSTDLNGDGDRDALVMTPTGLRVFMADPAEARSWIDVLPRGKLTNSLGIGTRVHVRAGNLRLATTCRDGLVSIPLGSEAVIDSVLLYWTNGIAQGVTTPNPAQCLTIPEREGQVDSCPFLYTFDGKAWQFIADCHSGTPLGLPYADRKYLPPRPDETVFVPGKHLRAVDGVLRVHIAEEFRELLYLDHVVLRAIDHPADARPVLNEAFRVMHHPKFGVHSLTGLRPPRSAVDHQGRDILPQVRARDGKHAVVWTPCGPQYTGLCHEWSITMDFGDLSAAERILFVMDGWVEFPTASASIAASQTKTVRFMMPVLEVMGPDGQWVSAHPEPGFPAGKTKHVLCDLTGKFHGTDGRLRLRSTQRLHWDAFSIATGPDQPQRVTAIPLSSAQLSYRGVGKPNADPSGELPVRFFHDDLETTVRWDQTPGMLTRYGDVRELLARVDDRYPILATGDLLALEFDASALPPLPAGWVRDYCVTTRGWVKDGDLNQAVRESVGPLPFRAMGAYPYAPDVAQPNWSWVEQWNTRPALTQHELNKLHGDD